MQKMCTVRPTHLPKIDCESLAGFYLAVKQSFNGQKRKRRKISATDRSKSIKKQFNTKNIMPKMCTVRPTHLPKN